MVQLNFSQILRQTANTLVDMKLRDPLGIAQGSTQNTAGSQKGVTKLFLELLDSQPIGDVVQLDSVDERQDKVPEEVIRLLHEAEKAETPSQQEARIKSHCPDAKKIFMDSERWWQGTVNSKAVLEKVLKKTNT